MTDFHLQRRDFFFYQLRFIKHDKSQSYGVMWLGGDCGIEFLPTHPIGMMQSRALSLSLSLELRSPGLPIERKDMLSTLKKNRTNKIKLTTKTVFTLLKKKKRFATHPQARPRSMDPLLMAPAYLMKTNNKESLISIFLSLFFSFL